MTKGRYLGRDKHGYEYYFNPDGYVYQWQCETCFGWLCTYAAWTRTLHKVLAISPDWLSPSHNLEVTQCMKNKQTKGAGER